MDRTQLDTDYEYVDVISAAEAVFLNTLELMDCCRIFFYIILWTEVCPEFVEGVLTTWRYFPDWAYYDGCTQRLESILCRVCPTSAVIRV
jgi:hypothetical protein